MAFSAQITLSPLGANAGPFNLYSDVDAYITPFESNIPRSSFLTPFTTNNVPDNTTIIEVRSSGICTNSEFLPISGLPSPTPTTTPTNTPTNTSTPTQTGTSGLPSPTPTTTSTNTPSPTPTSTTTPSPTPNPYCYTIESVQSAPGECFDCPGFFASTTDTFIEFFDGCSGNTISAPFDMNVIAHYSNSSTGSTFISGGTVGNVIIATSDIQCAPLPACGEVASPTFDFVVISGGTISECCVAVTPTPTPTQSSTPTPTYDIS